MWGKRRDPAALSAGVETAVERMKEWLERREAGQSEADSPPASEGESPAIPVDEGDFVLRHPARELDEPGVIAYGGYCIGGARLTNYSYRGVDDPSRQTTVEVVVHPDNYSYVVHDFFGTFWVVLNDPMARGSTKAPSAVFAFRDIAPAEGGKPQFVCVVIYPKEDGGSKGTFEGVIGWYENDGSSARTVMIRFSGLKGIPTTLIDQYLAEHPSSVQKDDPRFANWVANDIHKWTTLLQTRASEDHILQGARIQLRHYDRNAFGLDLMWGKRRDPAALSAGVDAAVERMNEWLEERQAAQNQKSEP